MSVILQNKIAIKSSGGKVFLLDRVAKTVTIYAIETTYGTDDPVGTLPSSEMLEMLDLIKGETIGE